MIEIKNLTKIYKTKLKNTTPALEEINLNLPSKGMIFVTGKSGSGKSTLLNMIGTLDTITSGDIIVDNHAFSNMNEIQFQEYRSSYLGFIFQDFLLLDELTIRENINLALNISGITDEALFDEIIKKVDLIGQEDKFPSELSGGQKQRVAIARALIKKPKMLLCDEPTGNLDFKTSKQILDILKEESKDKLVLIVSHNLEDAENYADRIIELMDGKIVRDLTKNKDYNNHLSIGENYVMLPHHKDLTNKEVNLLNEKIKESKFKVSQKQGGFFPTKEVEMEERNFKLESKHLTIKNLFKISNMFSRKNKHGIVYTILITLLFISLFYIFQTFLSYNGNESVKNNTNNDIVSVLGINDRTLQGTLSTSTINYLLEDDMKPYYDAGYEGNIFKFYNYTIGTGSSGINMNRYTRIGAMLKYNYMMESLGTLQCNIDYLTELYGVNGELIVLEGNIESGNKKLIVTDYFADSLIALTKYGYKDYAGMILANPRIGVVIYTGYKEKYQEILDKGISAKENFISSSDYIESMSQNELFKEFLNDVHDHLSIMYTFSEQPLKDLYKYHTNSSLKELVVEHESKKYIATIASTFVFTYNKALEGNNIHMSYAAYNEIFDTFYNEGNDSEFVPHSIKIQIYENNDPTKELIKETEVYIAELASSTLVSNQVLEEIYNMQYHIYGFYFDNIEQKELIYQVSEEQGLYINTVDTAVVPVIYSMLDIFKGFCYLIAGILFVVSFIHIVLYGINTIKKNLYEIGVLKALGTKVWDIGIIFVCQIALIGFAISMLSIAGIILASYIGNHLLISAFEDFLTITIYELKIIVPKPSIVSLDLTLVFIISVISSIIPLVYLKKLKPLNILKGNKK